MAKPKSKSTSAEQPSAWKSDIVERWVQKGTTSVWVSQALTAPDGKKMVGVRKLAKKADGTEVMTAAGITLPNSIDSVKALRKLSGMFKRMADQIEADYE